MSRITDIRRGATFSCSEHRAVGCVGGITPWFFATLVALTGTPLCAQDDTATEFHPLGGADTSSPRVTLETFIDACNDVYRRVRGEGRSYRNEAERRLITGRALRCLDLSQVPSSVQTATGREAAVCLKEVLDRIELPPVDTWPDDAQVTETETTKWTIPHTEITIAQAREGPRAGEFLFSPETVERAAAFYEIVKDLPYQEREKSSPEGNASWKPQPISTLKPS